MKIPVSVSIGAQVFSRLAKGDSIEDRFRSLLVPSVISEGCFLCSTDDEEFRAIVGGVMLSYGDGTPEFRRIEAEMQRMQKISAFLSAVQAGLDVSLPDKSDDEPEPIGLMKLWHERPKR